MESDTGISTKCFNNIILLTDSMGIGGLCGLHYENLSSWIDFRRSSMVIPIPKTHSLRGLARSGESWLIQCCSRCSKKQQMALGFGLPDFGKKNFRNLMVHQLYTHRVPRSVRKASASAHPRRSSISLTAAVCPSTAFGT